MEPEMFISDAEAENQDWCHQRGWTDTADMARLWGAGTDEEYETALRIGDMAVLARLTT